MTAGAPATSRSAPRLLSLDVFRGLTILAMLIVNSPGNSTAFAPLEHSDWNGCTLADLVFPFFLFIVGVSIVFSLARRRVSAGRGALVLAIVRRSAIIFALGLFLNGFPYYHLDTMRFAGVLQRIAVCYLAGASLYLWLSPSAIAVAAAVLLGGYWALMRFVPVPGFGPGVLTPAGNLASAIDRHFMRGHMWTELGDPEGFLSTLTAIATVLLGILAGGPLRRAAVDAADDDAARRRSMRGLVGLYVGAGIAGVAIGGAWGAAFPINKALWTSSFVLFTAGAALLVFALCLAATELGGWRRGTGALAAFGANAIAAYVLPLIDLKIQNRIPMAMADGSSGNLRLVITHRLFEGWLSAPAASLAYALLHTALWFVVFRALYRRRLFFKV